MFEMNKYIYYLHNKPTLCTRITCNIIHAYNSVSFYLCANTLSTLKRNNKTN